MDAVSVTDVDHQSLDDFSVCVQHERWTRQQLEAYQAQALQTCREYAYAHSPFYQRFHQGLMDRPLQELPVLTKAMVMEHFDELVTDPNIHLEDIQQYLQQGGGTPLYLDRYRVTGTSGSAGKPGIFFYSREESAIMMNSFTRTLFWGELTSESKAAVVTTTDPRQMSAQAPVIIDGRPVPRLQLSANEPLEVLVQRLNDWQPDFVLLYPSIGSILANEQRQGRLHISPRLIGCAAETLTSETRRRIEEAWPARLFQAYGTTESGILAAECTAHQGLHLFEDFSIVEVVDRQNRPVSPGEQGEKVLVTVLFRRAQPLIRYEVTDLIRTSTHGSCPCGRPFALIEGIEGRMPEMLYLPTPTGTVEGVHAFLFEFIMDVLPISGWQVVQEEDGLHIFLTGAAEDLQDEQLLLPLREALLKRGVLVPPMEVHRVTALTRNVGGKAIRLLSHVAHPTS